MSAAAGGDGSSQTFHTPTFLPALTAVCFKRSSAAHLPASSAEPRRHRSCPPAGDPQGEGLYRLHTPVDLGKGVGGLNPDAPEDRGDQYMMPSVGSAGGSLTWAE